MDLPVGIADFERAGPGQGVPLCPVPSGLHVGREVEVAACGREDERQGQRGKPGVSDGGETGHARSWKRRSIRMIRSQPRGSSSTICPACEFDSRPSFFPFLRSSCSSCSAGSPRLAGRSFWARRSGRSARRRSKRPRPGWPAGSTWSRDRPTASTATPTTTSPSRPTRPSRRRRAPAGSCRSRS